MLKNIVNYLIVNCISNHSTDLIFKYVGINPDDVKIIEIPVIDESGIVILFEHKKTNDSGYELYVGFDVNNFYGLGFIPVISLRTFLTDSDYDDDISVNDLEIFDTSEVSKISSYFNNADLIEFKNSANTDFQVFDFCVGEVIEINPSEFVGFKVIDNSDHIYLINCDDLHFEVHNSILNAGLFEF